MKTTLAALAIALMATTSHAAKMSVEKDGCNPGKDNTNPCWTVHIDGDIKFGDEVDFDKLIKTNSIKNALVQLNSDGGNLIAGLRIGAAIRDRGFTTYVANDVYCVSVCAAMWVAGVERYVASTAKVGFHQAYLKDPKTGRISYDAKVNDLVRFYYVDKLGLEKAAASFMTSADPKDIYWLNGDLAAGFHIDFKVVDQKTSDKHEEPAAAPTEAPHKQPDIFDIPAEKKEPARPAAPATAPAKKVQPQPHRQRYAGTPVRTCGVSIPVPYIGGITLRGRC